MAAACERGNGCFMKRNQWGKRLWLFAFFILLVVVPTPSIPAHPEREQTRDTPRVWFHASDRLGNEFLSRICGAGLAIPIHFPRHDVAVILWDEQSKVQPSRPTASASQKVSVPPR